MRHGQPLARASSVIASGERGSVRSMDAVTGKRVTIVSTCSATLPSRKRGRSTWPIELRRVRSRPQRSESAWRSTTTLP